MLEAMKVNTQYLVSRLSKLSMVANLTLGLQFLEEVYIKLEAKSTFNCFTYITMSFYM
jgi:hypothetical protein